MLPHIFKASRHWFPGKTMVDIDQLSDSLLLTNQIHHDSAVSESESNLSFSFSESCEAHFSTLASLVKKRDIDAIPAILDKMMNELSIDASQDKKNKLIPQDIESQFSFLLDRPLFGDQSGTILHSAIQNDAADIAILLLDRGAKWDTVDNRGYTSLDYACLTGNMAIIRSIIDLIPDFASFHADSGTNRQYAPLHLAAYSNQPQLVRLLLSKGASPFDKTLQGNNALTISVDSNSPHALKTLLGSLGNSGQDISILNQPIQEKGETLLHIAFENDYVQVAKHLLDYGADWRILDVAGRSPFIAGIESGSVDCIKLLLEPSSSSSSSKFPKPDYDDIHFVNPRDGNQPLHYAMQHNNVPVVQMLLKQKVDWEARNFRGENAIEVGVNNQNFEALVALFSCVVIPKSVLLKKDPIQGQTPLHRAVQVNNSPITALLLAHGADIFSTSKDYDTPLHFASYLNSDKSLSTIFSYLFPSQSLEKVEPILETKDDHISIQNVSPEKSSTAPPLLDDRSKPLALPTTRSSSIRNTLNTISGPMKATPLGLSAFIDGDPEILKTLIHYGADPAFGFRTGNSPLHIAILQANSHAFKILVQNTPLSILNSQYRVNLVNVKPITTSLLFQAIALPSFHHPDRFVRILLDRGVDTTSLLPDGLSVLHLAARLQRTDLVGLIIRSKQFDSKMLDSPLPHSLQTPIFSAILRSNLTTVLLLLDSGCNPSLVDSKNQNLYHYLNSIDWEHAFQKRRVWFSKEYFVYRIRSVLPSSFLKSKDAFGKTPLDMLKQKHPLVSELFTISKKKLATLAKDDIQKAKELGTK